SRSTNSASSHAAMLKTIEGIACRRKAKKSTIPRQRSCDRSTTQAIATLNTTVAVGTTTIRVPVVLSPVTSSPGERAQKLASDSWLKARPETGWRNGRPAAHRSINTGSNSESRKKKRTKETAGSVHGPRARCRGRYPFPVTTAYRDWFFCIVKYHNARN